MFNVFMHDKQISNAEVQAVEEKKHLKSISAQIKMREKLVKKNRLRTEKRIIEMSQDPVPISRKSYAMNLSTYQGEDFIRHRPKDSQERIKDAIIQNVWLDTVPLLPSPHIFRPRFKNKEIHFDMKYTPRDRYERVADTWESQRGTLNSSWHVTKKQGSDISYNGPTRFPNTLHKSYYKTIESVALEIPGSKNFTLPRVRSRTSVQDKASDIIQVRTLAQVAQELMEKCKLKPLRNELRSSYDSRSASLPLKNN